LISLVCIPAVYIGDWALTLLIFILTYWAAFEFLRLQKSRPGLLHATVLTFVILGYGLLLIRFPDLAWLFFLIPGFILLIFYLFFNALITRSLLLLLFCVTSIESILLLSSESDRFGYDAGLIILFIFFITSLNDIIQYLCGRIFGKYQLAPRVSPNKTIEGAIGGVILTGLIVALTLPFIMDVSRILAVLIGMFISILGILGDLSFSYFKRQASIKDTGTCLPGHGGLLDRIDSLTLTAPGFGLCLSLLG